MMQMIPTTDLEFEPTREEILITRIVDGEAFEDDWREFEALASTDAALWQRLARAQREQDMLERDVQDAVAVAELIDIPNASVHSFALMARFRQYSGWAVAAIISLALLTVMGYQVTGSGTPGNQAGVMMTIPADMPAEQIFESYMDNGLAQGVVVGEGPTLLVDVQILTGGNGYVVQVMRQIIERRELQDLQMFNQVRQPNGQLDYIPMRTQRVAGRAF